MFVLRSKDDPMKYVSIHLFYKNLNFLLRNVVFPFVELGKQGNLFQSYFFIRYSKGGTHIRLRLLTNEEEKLKIFAKHYFDQFFIEYLSTRIDQKDNFHSNNFIQFIDYKPEIERYGGTELIKVAEQYFYISSETVRQLMTYFDDWNDKMAVGIGLQIQIMFAHAIGFSKLEAQYFFESYYQNWLFVFDETTRKNDIFQSQFKISNHQTTIEFAKSLWLDLEENTGFENPFLKNWYSATQTLTKQFNQKNNQNHSIYESLLHMTNNRLGISNYDEVLLAFVLKNSLKPQD